MLTIALSRIAPAVQQLRILLEEVRETCRREPQILARSGRDLSDLFCELLIWLPMLYSTLGYCCWNAALRPIQCRCL